jgi:hypothetical protein
VANRPVPALALALGCGWPGQAEGQAVGQARVFRSGSPNPEPTWLQNEGE